MEQDEKKRLALAKFKEKIRTKMVSFWRKPDDLGGQFAIALNKAITLNPWPGWIRSTDAPSEKVVEELTRLSQENHSLRDKIDQLNSISPMYKEVDDVVSRLKNAEINIYFELTLSGKLINKEYRIQEKTIFLTIAQLASTGVIEDDLKYGLPHLITGESSASWSEQEDYFANIIRKFSLWRLLRVEIHSSSFPSGSRSARVFFTTDLGSRVASQISMEKEELSS